MKKILNNISLAFGYGYNCNSYLITSTDNETLMIDSGLGNFDENWGYSVNNPMEELLKILNSHRVTNIILTHAHLDHVGGVASLTGEQKKNINIFCHEAEKTHLESADSVYINPLNRFNLDPIAITRGLSNNDSLIIGEYTFDIIHTPGHTEGSMCLFESEKKILFSGDCVFPEGSFGRVDFPGSSPEKMLSSLEFLASLEIESLFAGHMEPILTNAKQSINQSYRIAKSMIY